MRGEISFVNDVGQVNPYRKHARIVRHCLEYLELRAGLITRFIYRLRDSDWVVTGTGLKTFYENAWLHLFPLFFFFSWLQEKP